MTQPAHATMADRPARPRPRRWPWVAGILVVLLAAALASYFVLREDDGGEGTVTTSGGDLNKPVKDGRFLFTVTAVRCGARIGDEVVDLEPQGTYCQVDVAVKNGGTTPRSFDSTAQKAYDDAGGEFSTDMRAETFVKTDGKGFLNEIPPGGVVQGTLVFDVPEDASVSSLVLHESFSSTGARVGLP